MKIKSSSIYKHTFPNGLYYIGKAVEPVHLRFNNGKGYLNKDENGNFTQPLIANAILEFGWENVKTDIIISGITTDVEIVFYEMYYIKYYNSFGENGYNMTMGGEGQYGRIVSEETRKDISNSLIEYYSEHPQTEETKNKRAQSLVRYYIEHPETKEKTKHCGTDNNNYKNMPRYVIDAAAEKNSIKIINITTNQIYNSSNEAERLTGINAANINKCCNHYRQSAGKDIDGNKYVWLFLEEYLLLKGV